MKLTVKYFDTYPKNELKAALSNLKKAKSLISKKERWIKGVEQDGNSYCCLGAIKKADGFGEVLAIDSLGYSINPESIWRDSAITDWNDDKKRCHRDVMRKFDAVIKVITEAISRVSASKPKR